MPRSLIIAAAAVFFSFITGVYLAYTYQENRYEAKIAKQEAGYQKAYAEEKTRAEKQAADFFTKTRSERNRTADYQAQKGFSISLQPVANSGSCFVPNSFVRLFNASATGDDTHSSDFDTAASTVNLTEVLSAIIENHGKYREAAAQINSIRAISQSQKE